MPVAFDTPNVEVPLPTPIALSPPLPTPTPTPTPILVVLIPLPAILATDQARCRCLWHLTLSASRSWVGGLVTAQLATGKSYVGSYEVVASQLPFHSSFEWLAKHPWALMNCPLRTVHCFGLMDYSKGVGFGIQTTDTSRCFFEGSVAISTTSNAKCLLSEVGRPFCWMRKEDTGQKLL